MFNTPSSLDDLEFSQDDLGNPTGVHNPTGVGIFGRPMSSRTARVAHRIFIILMVALGLWCVSIGCKVLPIFARPLIDGMPQSFSKDALNHVMDACDIIHVYTWKLFGWIQPTASRLWEFVVGLWSRFISWVNTLPYSQPNVG